MLQKPLKRRATKLAPALAKVLGASAFVLLMSGGLADAQGASGKLSHMTDLIFGETGMTFVQAPDLVATAKHFMKEENLHVEYIESQQSAQVCQQLLARAVDVGDCSVNDLIQIVQKSGAPLILVSNQVVSAINYGLMAQPKIKTWADLRGKTIMVGGPSDNTVYFTRVMTRAHGLKDSDYDFLYAGASNARFAALKAGAVGAAMLTDPFDSEAELRGFNRLGDLRPEYLNADNYAGGGLVTTKQWAKAHPKELVAYIKGFEKTISWMYDPKNKDEFFGILKARLNLTREAFDRTYERNIVKTKMWATDGGRTKKTGVQGVVNSLIELKEITPPAPSASELYSNTYVDMANNPD